MSSTTTIESDYDDQWIKDWQADAVGKADHFQGMIDNLTQWNQDRIGSIDQNTGNIANLTDWNDDRIEEIGGLNTRTNTNTDNIATLTRQYDTLVNSDPAEITRDSLGETFGSLIDNLSGLYDTVGSGSDLATTGDLFTDDDFTQSMTNRLTALGAQLNEDGELTGFKSFDKFDPSALQKLISDSEDDIDTLQGQFSGLTKDLVDDEGNAISVAEALAGQKQGLIDNYDLDNLDTRFDTQFGDINKLISGDNGTGGITGQLQEIFGNIGSADEADSILGQLSGLRSDLETDISGAATARDTLKKQLEKKLGTLGVDEEGNQISLSESLSKGLEGITSEYTDALSKSESGLRDERDTAIGTAKDQLVEDYGLGTLQDDLGDIYKTRETAIENLTGDFAKRLQSQEADLSARIDQQDTAFDEKVGKMQSMMNYRMLGDSAGGIKMRRSKAYKSGAVNTGTGQLSRSSLKLNTLNI